MKILQIDDVFHPDAGYTANIISKYFVQAGHQTRILTSELDKIPAELKTFFGEEDLDARDNEYTENYGVEIRRLPIKAYISGRSIYYTRKLKTEILEYDPDILYIHGNDSWGAYWCLKNRKCFRAAIVTDSHMLDMAGRNPFRRLYHTWYRKSVAPIIIRNHVPVIRIQNDDYVERRLGVPLPQAPLISVGSDTMLFHPDTNARERFRMKYGIPKDAFVILYAGKMDESKGGMLLADALNEKIGTDKELVFIVVGNTIGEYGEKVEELFKSSKNRVLRFPTQKYSSLPPFYQASDAAVFPKQCSLSFYDVQACGLPVIFENNNINRERGSYGNALIFRSGDIEDLREKLKQISCMPSAEYSSMAKAAVAMVRKDYDYKDISKEYLKVFERALQEQGKK